MGLGEDIFNDFIRGQAQTPAQGQGETVRLVQEYERRIERLKAKARTQIDRAYNKALEDAIAAADLEDGGRRGDVRADAIRELKRKVRPS